MLTIRELNYKDNEQWDCLVRESDETYFHHQLHWKMFIESQYPKLLTPVYLIARNGTEIEGVLPLFRFKHRFFGKRLISIPFSTHGGCCARTKEATEALVKRAIQLAQESNADHLELRGLQQYSMPELVADDTYFTLKLKLEPDFKQLQKKIRATTRRYIRRSEENDFVIKLFSDDLDAFFKLYSIGQRNLGTPSTGYRYLKNLIENFKSEHHFALAYHKQKLVAGILLRDYKQTATYVLGASLLEYRQLYPNYRLFNEVLKHYSAQGFQWFDFGRSIEDSGTYFFKRGWGAEPLQFHYHFFLNARKHIPGTSQASPKRVMFANVWKRLPLPVATTLGPAIRRYFP
ncbi:GNAT family N-acetyltransferase [candidate division KSB1 bacterium]|nr:GNAT family N-acetyltransferase [candidate division KSB1 bacterium]